jgi:hypothetical protein
MLSAGLLHPVNANERVARAIIAALYIVFFAWALWLKRNGISIWLNFYLFIARWARVVPGDYPNGKPNRKRG